MGQTWRTLTFSTSHVAVSDLQDFEDNFLVLRTNWSGTTAPTATVAGQTWFDTTNKVLKVRNAANNGWQGIMAGSSNAKMWVYLNSAPDGWTYHSSVTDDVVAISGGSTYTTPGSVQGSWTMSGITSNSNTHNHQWYLYYTTYGWSWTDSGTAISMTNYVHSGGHIVTSKGDPYGLSTDYYTKNATHSHTSTDYTSDWRPASAVGILVYPSV